MGGCQKVCSVLESVWFRCLCIHVFVCLLGGGVVRWRGGEVVRFGPFGPLTAQVRGKNLGS